MRMALFSKVPAVSGRDLGQPVMLSTPLDKASSTIIQNDSREQG